jgi:hypothetical protein
MQTANPGITIGRGCVKVSISIGTARFDRYWRTEINDAVNADNPRP